MIRAIIITKEFALSNDGSVNDRNVFSYFMTYDGGYYCNDNYINTNPNLFTWDPIEYANISLSDIVVDEPVIL